MGVNPATFTLLATGPFGGGLIDGRLGCGAPFEPVVSAGLLAMVAALDSPKSICPLPERWGICGQGSSVRKSADWRSFARFDSGSEFPAGCTGSTSALRSVFVIEEPFPVFPIDACGAAGLVSHPLSQLLAGPADDVVDCAGEVVKGLWIVA